MCFKYDCSMIWHVYYKHLWPKPTNYNALFRGTVILYSTHAEQTKLKVEIHHFNMKFFRIMKVSLAIFFVFQVLDDFAAGQHNIMVSTNGPEQFPIIRARKSICFSFYNFVVNSTISLLNLSNKFFTDDLQ
jgi:hypothetical protein